MNSTPANRRELLNQSMSSLISEGKDCFSCVGHCCTYEHNSMRVSPLEAMDALEYLEHNNQINKKLIENLESCIKKYRLDKELLVRKDQELRRYYTCPLYKGENLGCSIGKHHKPYGCLAFNPLKKKVKEAGNCHSYTEALKKREDKYSEEEIQRNERLKDQFNIYWNKKDLPSALRYLIKKIYSL